MKKILLTFLLTSGLFLFLNRYVYSANPQCDAAGGRCDYACGANEKAILGNLDCDPTLPRKTCCIQVTPGPPITPSPGTGALDTLDMMDNIPGITCGIPFNPKIEPAKDKNKACIYSEFKCEGIINKDLTQLIVNVVGKIPFVGGIISGIWNNCLQAEQRIKAYQDNLKSPCIFGEIQNINGNLLCVTKEIVAGNVQVAKMCNDYVKSAPDLSECLDCAGHGKYYSGVGCVSMNLTSFISETLLGLGVSLGGLFALLCIIYSAFRIQTSQGNPETIKKAQETLTSCILGLILIIFAIFILRLIGVDILRIPFLK